MKPRTLSLAQHERIHLIGVGGVGMSALAAILAERGFTVSGSDRSEKPRLDRLREMGVAVSVPQVAGGAGDADLVVASAAIPERNPELLDARNRGIPVYHRADLLAAIVRGMNKVAVSGTHGKTTTTAMLGTIMLEVGRDPLVIVGGDAANLGANFHAGDEPLAIFEACESDASFLRYGPCSEVITNIEADHLDQYGDFASVCRAFGEFIDLVPEDGFLVYGTASPELSAMAVRARGDAIAFGLSQAPVHADEIELELFGSSFQLVVDGDHLGRVRLRVPGEHNVANALGALTAAHRLGVAYEDAMEAVAHYRGVGRRFEEIGRLGGALVIDDYAHHPTEVAATLAATRRGWPERRIVAIFQPHLYSRTRDFIEEFAQALSSADVVIIADIYGAREDPIEGVEAADLAREVAALAPDADVRFIPDHEDILEAVRELAASGDVILTLGAGDIRRVAEELTCV